VNAGAAADLPQTRNAIGRVRTRGDEPGKNATRAG
jgi:hypothetical protein